MKILRIIGWTEIAIGAITLFATVLSLLKGTNNKTPPVLFFVILAATLSALLGIGILRLNRIAYLLLLYFASVVFLSKTLIFLDVIHLNGALVTALPEGLKNWSSLIYHAGLCFYLLQPGSQKDLSP